MRGTIALALALGAAPLVQGAIITYATTLSGPAESPPNASPGTGWALVTYDNIAHTLNIDTAFSGLTGTTTAAHIHCCSLPTAGVATQTPTFTGFPLGVSSGVYNNTFDLTLSSSWNAAFITANGGTAAGAEAALAAGLNNGAAYLNLHSSAFPGGEIRGFLVATPEPASGLLLLAPAALFWLRRRRER